MIIDAKAAKEATTQVIETQTRELQKRIGDVIQAAILQGAFKANFYPRSAAELDIAVPLLRGMSYDAHHVSASDQRDKDFIRIEWK